MTVHGHVSGHCTCSRTVWFTLYGILIKKCICVTAILYMLPDIEDNAAEGLALS